MAKYSFEFKKQLVQAYLKGEGSYDYLSQLHNIPSSKVLKDWVAAYREFGDKGIMRSRKQSKYSFQFKLHVVELYLTREVSYQELALSQGINNPSLVSKWVNDYRDAGPDALRPKQKGRRQKLETPKKSVPNNSDLTNQNEEYVKQLEDELLRLRIENAYLKELRRLRLEEEALQKKRRESSTVSEENSD